MNFSNASFTDWPGNFFWNIHFFFKVGGELNCFTYRSNNCWKTVSLPRLQNEFHMVLLGKSIRQQLTKTNKFRDSFLFLASNPEGCENVTTLKRLTNLLVTMPCCVWKRWVLAVTCKWLFVHFWLRTGHQQWFPGWKSCVWPIYPLWPPPYVDFVTNYALSTDFLLCSHHNNYTYWINRNTHHNNLPAQTSYIVIFSGRRFSSPFSDIFGMFQGHFLFFTVFYDALYACCCFRLSICFFNQSSIYWTV